MNMRVSEIVSRNLTTALRNSQTWGIARTGDELYQAALTTEGIIIPTGVGTITLSSSQVSAVLSALYRIESQDIVSIILPSGVHEFTGDEIARISSYNANIKLVGADTVDTTISGVASVTGSNGNYAVTFELADATGIEVGDVLQVSDVAPGKTYSLSSDTRRPYTNELTVGFYKMGSLTTSTGNRVCTLGTGNQNTHLQVGDLVHVRGQTRVIDSIDAAPAKTFTVDVAWDFAVSEAQWWYYTKPNTGTIGTGGSASTTVTGVGTSLTTEANIGDLLLVDGQFYKITGVASNTSLTVSHNITLADGKKYSIITAGILHEGSFEVTGVSGNNVTVRNRSRYAKPPAVGISTATVKSIKTVLKNTGTGNGFVFERGGILNEMSRIALQGNGSSTSSVGVALNGFTPSYDLGNGNITLAEPSAVIEWGYGVTLSSGSVLYGYLAHICNNFTRGVDASEGSEAYLRSAVISHNNGIGVFVSGGFVRMSEARFCGNADQGLRQDVGSSAYGDMPYAWGNGSHGFMMVNFCGIQFVDGFSVCNGGKGGDINGGGGRVTRTLFAGNASHNLSVYNGKVEATQCWFSGGLSGQSGLTCSNAEVTATTSAATGNGGNGYYGLSGARITATECVASKNLQYGARATDISEIQITDSYTTGNTSGAVNTLTGGTAMYDSNEYGTRVQGGHYREITIIADDAVLTIPIGLNITIAITIVSRTVSTVYGIIRANIAASPSIASIAGTGITTTTGVLTGTTGTDGNFTVSAGSDGNLYIENRMGGSREITIDIVGKVSA